MKIPDFLKGTNFYFAIIMVILSLFGGSENLANQIIATGVGVIAAFGAIRQFVNSAKFGGWYKTLIEGNTLNYLASVIMLLGVPNVDQLIPPLKDFADAVIQGNWGLIVSRGVTLLTIAFYLFIKKGSVSAAK